jgi:hypothetical protein
VRNVAEEKCMPGKLEKQAGDHLEDLGIHGTIILKWILETERETVD